MFSLHALHLPGRFAATGRCFFLPNLTVFTGLEKGPELAGIEETCPKTLRTIFLLKPRWSSLPPRFASILVSTPIKSLSGE